MMRAALWISAALLALGCGHERELQVGSKASTENQILAEMIALVARGEGVPVRKLVPYGNTFDCQEGVKSGEIDVYPEYTGTALSMMGAPPTRAALPDGGLGWVPDADFAKVKALFAPFGLRWLDRLGVDDRYVLVVRPGFALRHNIREISDLTKLDGGARLGVESEFQDRIIDGLPALERRYGLTGLEVPVVADSKKRLYDALIKREIDVAVGYSTDGRIEEFNLQVLEDDLRLFSPYEVAPLVREEALEAFPALEPALRKLAGALDVPTMRRLNKQVELSRMAPREVARAFLIEAKLIEEPAAKRTLKPLWIALPPATQEISRLDGLALAALRAANPGRPVKARAFVDPTGAVTRGAAFAAITGAEFFFERREGALPERVEGIEAVCPVGFKMSHVITRRGRGLVELPLARWISALGLREGPDALRLPLMSWASHIGVGVKGGTTHRVAALLLDAYGARGQVKLVFGAPRAQLEAVAEGGLDAALVHVEIGAPSINLALRDQRLTLAPVMDWEVGGREFRTPFIRRARIPADAYPGLLEGLDTISTQVVIVGPAHQDKLIGDHGPVEVITSIREPIPKAMKQKLVKSIEGPRMIDPTLPGESVGVSNKVARAAPLNPTPEVSMLTGLLLLFLAYVFVEIFRAREEEGGAPSEEP